MSVNLGVLKGHTQAVLCAEVLSAQHLLAPGGNTSPFFDTYLLLIKAGNQQG